MRSQRAHATGLLLACLLLAPPARADGGEPNSRADEYFRQGKALVKEDRLEEARRAYLEGYRLKKGYDIAGNLGNVELELGLPRDAAEHLAYCLKSFPATATASQLEYIKGRFNEAQRRVATLSVQVNVDGAEVFVDGQPIGRSPFEGDVFVLPGKRTLEARLPGYSPAQRLVDAGKGSWQSVALVLAPARAGTPRGGAVTVIETPAPVKPRSRAPIYAGAIVTIAGAGAGVAGLLISNSSAADAANRFNQLKSASGPSACLDPAHRAACDELDHAYLQRSMFRTVSIAGFAVAGTAALATLAYGLSLSSPDPPRPSKISAGAAVAPGAAAAFVMGRF